MKKIESTLLIQSYSPLLSQNVRNNPRISSPGKNTELITSGHRSPEYGVKGKDPVEAALSGIYSENGVLQRGVSGSRLQGVVMKWVDNSIDMVNKALTSLKSTCASFPARKVQEVFSRFMPNDNFNTVKIKMENMLENILITLKKHKNDKGANFAIVRKSSPNSADVFHGDKAQRIFVKDQTLNAPAEFTTRLLIHEASHFYGTKDNGYLDIVTPEKIINPLDNADSIAYATEALANLPSDSCIEASEGDATVSNPGWNASTDYKAGDRIRYNNDDYQAKSSVRGTAPLAGFGWFYWEQVTPSSESQNNLSEPSVE